MNVTLLVMLVLPLAAALVLLAGRRVFSQESARQFALVAAVATLAASIVIMVQFLRLPATSGQRGPVEPRYSVTYHWLTYAESSAVAPTGQPLRFDLLFGLDSISLALVVLTTILTVSCVLISWDSIREWAAGFYACLLLLEAGLIGVFCAFDLILFYVFFEFTLVPLFFLIGIWGGPQRRYAAIKFFLYTFVGSLVTLVGLVALVLTASSAGVETPCSIPALAAWLAENPLSHNWQVALFLAIAVGFMVKVPVFPLHTWLPLAHVEAPTAGSVMLAGVLLKLGTYGFLRLCLPLFPYACQTVGVALMAVLAVAGIIYGSLCALAQRDIKKLVAYSSVAHLGFCMLGLFALNSAGISGGVLQMINHGLSTGALFLLVGMIYDRYHTRQLDDLGGLAARLPLLACTMVFIAMSSIGLPGLNGFVGEVLSLIGMFRRHPVYAVLGTTGIVLGAWYLLTMIQHAFFGPLREPAHGGDAVRDMNAREVFAIAPICALCLWIGVMPQPLLDTIRPDVDAVVALYDTPAETDRVASDAAKSPNPQLSTINFPAVIDAIAQIQATASLLVPEIILLLTTCAMFLIGPMLVTHAGEAAPGLRHGWGILSLAALGFAWAVWFGGDPGDVSQGALFRVDALTWYTRGLSLSAGILIALVLWNQIDDSYAAEAHACLLAILAGTNLVAAADDLVSLFLALELVSIPTYVLLYLPRRDRAGREAAVKYFLLSVFASALVLYGMSWLYGASGSTNLAAIAAALGQESPEGGHLMRQIAFALLLAGLSFRIAAVPFHFYAPDVFQGTTASNAALLSFVPKVVGFVALLRLLPLTGVAAVAGLSEAGYNEAGYNWLPAERTRLLLAILAVATMFVGNLMALRQSNLYRLMAYSSIAHAGYMLIGLAVGDAGRVGGSDAVLFYLAAYGLMTIGVFALFSGIDGPDRPLSTDVELRGLSRTQPSIALLLAVCLFSLTGLPPTAGFLGKLNLFLAAWSEATPIGRTLAILMGFNAAIAAWYYLRLVALMYLEPATQREAMPRRVAWWSWLAGAACTFGTVGLFSAPQWLWQNLP